MKTINQEGSRFIRLFLEMVVWTAAFMGCLVLTVWLLSYSYGSIFVKKTDIPTAVFLVIVVAVLAFITLWLVKKASLAVNELQQTCQPKKIIGA
ncbi:MAG: hypothetical protein PHG23_02435 [Candidatus Pacebacteria bacterium]|nr:hypothetical protein [Candidatus Paceibacterota bacterium]